MISTFHQRDGWCFARLADGSVRIEAPKAGFHVIPPAEWASVVAHVANKGGTAAEYSVANKLHFGVLDAPVTEGAH